MRQGDTVGERTFGIAWGTFGVLLQKGAWQADDFGTMVGLYTAGPVSTIPFHQSPWVVVFFIQGSLNMFRHESQTHPILMRRSGRGVSVV